MFPIVDANLPKFGDQVGLLTRPGFLAHLALTVAAFAATFSVYSYFTVWLNAVVGMDMHKVAITLFGFGAAGFLGNLVASRIADRIPVVGTLAAVAAVTAAAAAAASYHGAVIIFAPLLAIWGAAHIAVVTLCQVRVITAGGRAPAFAISMNISAANLGIAIGTLIGGFVINRAGLDAIAIAPIGLTTVVAATAALVPRAARVCKCSI
jgi:DHA1 family inner membrane transport protein